MNDQLTIKWCSRIVLLFIHLSIFSSSIYSQNKKAITKEEFANLSNEMSDSVGYYFEIKDYKKVIDVLKMWLESYEKLDSSGKAENKPYLLDVYYNLACSQSLILQKKEALVSLEKSVNSGYNNYQHTLEDSDLNNIKNEPEYKRIIQILKEKGDFLYILSKASAYDNQRNENEPKFTYQDSSYAKLKELRLTYNLDSIMGEGNDISQIINLMRWVHNLVPHDGQHSNPEVKNTFNFIEVCKKDKRGLNCRGLATVLNEVYLASGFKSRVVTCIPRDTSDFDCHVINAVYSPSLKKWVWMDPTNEAYVMDEQGVLLGIQEVRDRLINGKMLILNPDANWNHRSSATKEGYLYNYMAKNLYYIDCISNSEYDVETKKDDKKLIYYRLISSTDAKDKNYIETKNYIKYLITNPYLFWKTP